MGCPLSPISRPTRDIRSRTSRTSDSPSHCSTPLSKRPPLSTRGGSTSRTPGGGNPYNVLPSYFMDEVAALDPSPVTTTTTVPPVTTTTTTATTTTFSTSTSGGSVWQPSLNTSWQWQLTGQIDLSIHVEMYDIDAFGN